MWACVLGYSLGTAAFQVLDARYPFPEAALHPPGATLVTDASGEELRWFLATDDHWRFPVELDQVSPVFLKALVASEDAWFGIHPGVDPVAVVRALMDNLRAGHVVSGASTIPMQIARLAEPRPRTLKTKVIEAFRALQLCTHHSRDELLEYYVNLTPYGGNIVGVGAAARFYFGKPPAKLSLAEAALLTALPRAPGAWHPVLHPQAALQARNLVLTQLAERGVFEQSEVDQALARPLPTALARPPLTAPHLCRYVLERQGRQPVIRTSLDARLQRLAERILAGRAKWLHDQGIENGAVVVLDSQTRHVLAMAGSTDFLDDAHHGQINGALIARSPGSTLKPFLYALAMDQGLLMPQSLVLDVPTDYAGYAPKNYDGSFSGLVTVEHALSRSLNVPAVRTLASVGLDKFHTLLRQGGLATVDRPASHYGLPLALGACEVRLLDLANLYADLASGGTHRAWRVTAGPAMPGFRLLSPEAAWLVTNILAQVTRPDMPQTWQLTSDAPTVAWKTGTSFGHRDAWAVGFSNRLTIGVWVGNLDGTPRKGISGASHAGPLLFELFRALEGNAAQLPEPPRQLDLAEVTVCAPTRMLPSPFCPETMSMTVIPGVTRLEPDHWTKRLFVDQDTGLRLSGECLARHPHQARVLVEYPVELTAWLASMGAETPGPPPLHPDCAGVPEGAPRILSPLAETPYLLRPGAPAEFQRIPLKAASAPGVGRLTWYADGLVAAQGGPGEPLFLDAEPGEHRLVVVDDQGRMDAVTIQVR